MKYIKVIKVIGLAGGLLVIGGLVGLTAHTAAPTDPIIKTVASNVAKQADSITPDTTLKSSASSQGSASTSVQSTIQDSPAPSPVVTTTPTEIVTEDGTHYPLRHYETAAYNDPKATQWWTSTIGLPTFWNLTATPSYTPTIAVIDTGFALAHEEFAGRWATNAADPVNGIDDDGNGYVDDWRGWDFAYNDNNPQAGVVNPSGDGVMHGTMTAGAAAATGGNGVGIVGVSQSANILPVQVMDDNSQGNTLTVARGVMYAAKRHADIISISLGTSGDDPYLRSVIDYAIRQGSVVVASAGNTSCDCLAYPANYPEVVAVGSVSQAGSLSSFSSYGANLDLLAPGENMTLPAWSASYPTSGYVTGMAGTSFSAPLVSGALANLKALSPSSTGGELVAALKETADHASLSSASPHTPSRGYGVLNAGQAAVRVTTLASPTLRYNLGPATITDALGSARPYACMDAAFPSAELFEIENTTAKGYAYTISDLDVAAAVSAGQTVRSLGYQCVGQPVDHPTTVRQLNLSNELH